MKIMPMHCLPVREGVRVSLHARGEDLGGTKVKVTFPVRCSVRGITRLMSFSILGSAHLTSFAIIGAVRT
jgi:hypothetical protein